ncbi:MAG TPA: DMT family transporter [Candidatus Eisenbacteria bacterium]|nr:DMT family transporter [Candidatus Eisenbacteria bacterium]
MQQPFRGRRRPIRHLYHWPLHGILLLRTLDLILHATEKLTAGQATRSALLPAYLALAGGVICISWSAIFVRWTDIPGPASAFYRMLIPALVLLPTYLFDGQGHKLDWQAIGLIWLGGFFFAGDLALYNSSILQTSAANATLFGNNTPIFVGLLTWLVFRRSPGRSFWIGLLMAIIGGLVILSADLKHQSLVGLGDLMAVGASACFAVYLMVTEKIRASTGTLGFLRLAMIASTVALFLMNLAMGISLRVPHGRTLWAVIGLGLVSQLGGYLFLTYALGHLPATLTSISLLTQGPLTAAMAAVLLNEPLTLAQIFGGILVLAGVALAHRQRHPEDEANV